MSSNISEGLSQNLRHISLFQIFMRRNESHLVWRRKIVLRTNGWRRILHLRGITKQSNDDYANNFSNLKRVGFHIFKSHYLYIFPQVFQSSWGVNHLHGEIYLWWSSFLWHMLWPTEHRVKEKTCCLSYKKIGKIIALSYNISRWLKSKADFLSLPVEPKFYVAVNKLLFACATFYCWV